MPPITITYTFHPSTPSNPALHQALSSIRLHLPLRNLHWKPTSRTSIRTIQEVEVNLIELGDAGPSTAGRFGGSVMEGPLVNLCLVVCEDSEAYKNSTRSFIRDWLSLLSARRNVQAPLIVLVNPHSSSASSGKNVFGRDKGVLGKLRSDFSTAKRDKCVQVNLPPEGKEDPAAWPEFLSKLKESVVTAFDEAVVEKEEEVKRGEAQRMMVGWNFCTWFLVKESLAISFESVGLAEDALVIYEELEATFFQILKEQNLSWFGKLGATSPRDDSLPVLDLRAKHYREMLQSSTITIFDFRIYVFARQAILLGKLGRITEIAKRGQWFVASLTRRLRESEPELAEYFIESWTYTACMDIVQRCDEWSRIDRPNGDYSGLIAYESARSELLDIARIQVERIGVASGHLPDTYPFAPTSAIVPLLDDVLFENSDDEETDQNPDDSPVQTSARPRLEISNAQLLEAKSDSSRFRSLYLNLTKKAIQAYEACGKVNSVIRLKADLTALAMLVQLHSQEWQAVYGLSRNLARDCAELLIWEPVAKFALQAALQSHRELQMSVDEEWTNLALAYMRVCAVEREKTASSELENVLANLRESGAPTEGLQMNYPILTLGLMIVNDHKAFKIGLTDRAAKPGENADLTQIDVEIVNFLDQTVQVASIEIELESENGRISFSASNEFLHPGPNSITTTCYTSVQGIYHIRNSSIFLGSVILRYYEDAEDRLVQMRRGEGSVSTVLKMPQRIALDEESHVVVEVNTGRCQLYNARIQLISNDQNVQYILDRARIDQEIITSSEAGLVLGDLGKDEQISLSIPYTGVSSSEQASVTLIIDYDSPISSSRRTYIDTQSISMGLPLTVNVQDFFRPDCLLSHFTLASDGKQSLRVKSVELRPSTSYTVGACRKNWDNVATLTPSESLSCLFKISAGQDYSTSKVDTVLRLVIQYMTVEEELQAMTQQAIKTIPLQLKSIVRERLADRSDWFEKYLATQNIATVFNETWKKRLDSGLERPVSEFTDTVLETGNVERWRTLEIPVEIPSPRLLTTIHMSHTSPTSTDQIYEGRAFSLMIRFDAIDNWTPAPNVIQLGPNKIMERKMVFDILANPEDWIVIGKKKGYYITNGTTQEREIVLVPTHQGYLPLPSISVSVLPTITGNNQDDIEGELFRHVICETYVKNAAELVRVLPAKGGVTALVPLESAWEVEAEQRRMNHLNI